jgi:hypothetical protein
MINESIYDVRIADMLENRYEYSDLSRSSNIVLEIVQLVGSHRYNPSNIVNEG